MSQFKEIAVGGTVYFWFAANLTTGAAGDGATPLYDVRLAGASSSGAPTASGTPTLLTHANYTDGLHEIAIDTTGYAEGEYAVFSTLTISTVNPAGFCGSFVVRAAAATLRDLVAALQTSVTTIDDFLDTEVAAIKAKTDNLPAAPASTTNITAGTITTATNVTTVNGLAAGVITAAAIATGAIDADALAADAVTEIWAGSTAPTAAVIADAVLDEDMTGHQTQGSLGQAIGDPVADTNTLYKAVVTDAAGATVGVDVVAMKVDTAAILVDTGTTLDAAIADLPTNAELATALGTADDAVLAQIALVKAKTDNLPTDPADQSLIITATDALVTLIEAVPTNAELATALGTADDAVLAQVALVKTQTDKLTFTVTNVVDANIQRINDVAIIGDGSATPFDV